MRPGARLIGLLAANAMAVLAVVWAHGLTWDTAPISVDREPGLLLDDTDPATMAKNVDGVGNFAVKNAVSRPLFSHKRRAWRPPPPPKKNPPKKVAAAKAPPKVEAKPDFELIGVSIARDAASALFRKTGTDESVWVNRGAKAWEWVVVEISDDKVVLEQSGQQAELTLYPALQPAIR